MAEQTAFEQLGIEPDEITPSVKRKTNNPNGRPKGSVNEFHRVRKKVQQLLNYHAFEVLENLTKCCLALEPNPLLMKLFLLYWAGPPLKRPIALDLAPVTNANELRQAMLEIHRRVTSGEIDPENGAALVEMQHRILHALSMDTMANGPTPVPEGGGDSRQLLADRLARVLEQKRLNGSAGLVQPELSERPRPGSPDEPDDDEDDEEDDEEAPFLKQSAETRVSEESTNVHHNGEPDEWDSVMESLRVKLNGKR